MSAWELIGWASNVCVFSRFLVQWAASERAQRSVVPRLFWWLSLAGAALFGIYSLHRGQYVLLVGVVVNGLIYTRNLWIARVERKAGSLGRSVARAMAIIAIALLSLAGLFTQRSAAAPSGAWVVCVVVGQILWSSRFVIQWWSTERHGVSHIPALFWWVSLSGNVALLSYALHLADPVYVAGFLFGPPVQIRNIILITRAQNARCSLQQRAQAGNRPPASLIP